MRTIALYSDIHGNALALDAVLADIAASGIHERYCLGDLVGYGPMPEESVVRVRRSGDPIVRGNYDRAIGEHRGDCGSLHSDPQETLDAAEAFAYTINAVSAEHQAYLAALPEEIRLDLPGATMLLCHGIPGAVTEGLAGDAPAIDIIRHVRSAGVQIVCAGHAHEPFHRSVPDGVTTLHWVNPGSVGRPTGRDPRAVWSEVVIGGRGEVLARAHDDLGCGPLGVSGLWLGVVVHRVEYRNAEVHRMMMAKGLPGGLAAAFKAPLGEVRADRLADPPAPPGIPGSGASTVLQSERKCVCALGDRITTYESLAAIFGGPVDSAGAAVRGLRDSIRSCRVSPNLDEVAIIRSIERADVALASREGAAAFEAERRRLYGADGRFDPFTNVLSPSEVTYVSGAAKDTEAALRTLYREAEFEPPGECSPGHIAVELSFMAHCLRRGSRTSAAWLLLSNDFFVEHLAEWAILFAVVIGQQAREPVTACAGAALDKHLACEASIFRHAVPEYCELRGTAMPESV